MHPKVLDPKVHVSKPDNEASERKEGGLRFVMRTEKGGAAGSSGLLSQGLQVRSGVLGEHQVEARA